jgi:hypothetical protein
MSSERKAKIHGYDTHKDKGGGVDVTSNKTGKTYHAGSVSKAKHIAHLHEVFSHMKGK